MASQQNVEQHHSPFLLHNLYCTEQHCEEDYFYEQDDQLLQQDNYYYSTITNDKEPNPGILFQQDLLWEETELVSLLSKEHPNKLHKTVESDPSLAEARAGAVEWILKVNTHYTFSALTAILAVDYLDRFLSSFHFQKEKPWMTQLAAVACVSLAAKVEETHVPLLLDLQVESKFLFEAKTIERMEILVLSTLQWRMNPVTPLSFLDFITRRLGLKNRLCWEFLRKCEQTLLSLVLDCRFMSFLPSVTASATMLHVVNSVEPCLVAEYQNQLLGILGIDKDKVDKCSRFISDASRGHSNK